MIELRNLTKQYGENVIFDGANYTFPETGIVCLMGASGGGKTTLLNLLAGFDTDYEGELLVGGTALHALGADALCAYRRDNIGFVFQNYHLLAGYTVLENVCLAAALSKESEEEAAEKAAELLARLGIAEKAQQKVENLSGGQKQRVAIARALMGNPQILLADEPTGALDRATSTEIMQLLQEIAKDRLVVVITHDAKVGDFAGELIHIEGRQICAAQPRRTPSAAARPLRVGTKRQVPLLARALKNVRVHLRRFVAVSLVISIGLLAFLFSLSFGNVMEHSILAFQEKNTAFQNGYIRGEDDGTILKYLRADARIEDAFYQYKLEQIGLTVGGSTERMDEKFPLPKATESLSYGVMPRKGQGEVALSPSLAKKFGGDMKRLLGQPLTLNVGAQTYELSISGIYNAGYDDFFVSSDVERRLYQHAGEAKNYSISYDVKEFSNVVAVSNGLELRGIAAKTAAGEVSALQATFASLNRLFLVISVLILALACFLCAVLLVKLQNARCREVGLLSALGFSRAQIGGMILGENLMLAGLATAVNLLLVGLSLIVSHLLGFELVFGGVQVLASVAATFAVVLLLSAAASRKLLHTQPAAALRA